MKLQHALDAIIDITGPNITIRRMANALTNRVYQIRSAQSTWALRVNNADEFALGLNRKSEQNLLDKISEQPWAVDVDYIDNQLLLCKWINGGEFEGSPTELGQLMNQVHNMRVSKQDGVRPLNITEQIKHLLSQQTNLPNEFTHFVEQMCQRYQMPEVLVLCHHDWHSGNIIQQNKQPIILDWEYATLGDPLIDLACLAAGFKLNDEQLNLVAKQASLDIASSAWPLAICLTELMALAWYGVRQPEKNWQAQQDNWRAKWYSQFH